MEHRTTGLSARAVGLLAALPIALATFAFRPGVAPASGALLPGTGNALDVLVP